MKLVERHIIKSSSKYFKEFKEITHYSKNLYNYANYIVRQEYISNKKFLGYTQVYKLVKDSKDYKKLHSHVSQQILKLLEKNWKSYFALLKSENMKGKKIRIPNYLDKDGYYIAIYTNYGLSKVELQYRIIKPSKTKIRIKTRIKPDTIKQARIIPKGNHFIIEVVYNYSEKKLKKDNKKYFSIDLGINNLATVSSNEVKPFIINGKILKSINQYYNKKKSEFQSKLPKGVYTSKRIQNLSLKRNNIINDYLHKSSRYIINQAVSNKINTIVIGYNKGWKQEINIGKVNNQKFVGIPFLKFINQLIYKAKIVGIKVILTEESYTSKCSFIDKEELTRKEKYLGERVYRGLYKSSSGRLMNADLNGSLNILRKVIGNFRYPVEVCGTPKIINIYNLK